MSQAPVKAEAGQETAEDEAPAEEASAQAFLDLREYLALRAEAADYLRTRPKVMALIHNITAITRGPLL